MLLGKLPPTSDLCRSKSHRYLPDRRGGDAVAKPYQFALDAAVPSPGREFSLASRTTSVLIAVRAGGRPVRRFAESPHLRAMNLSLLLGERHLAVVDATTAVVNAGWVSDR